MDIKCKYASGGDGGVCNEASCGCLPIGQNRQCVRLKDNPLLRYFNPSREVAIVWSIDDVLQERPHLTEAQAMDVLEVVSSKHDATLGVCWETLRTVADDLFPEED